MITIRDWIATIPEADKPIAFVGEHQSVTREFLLTGTDWETYKDWGFHLDMAFDLSSVTSREQYQRETTRITNTENVTETQVVTAGTTTKESHVVEDVEVDCAARTDIASLGKTVREDGILLTWEVLRQHTQLPGKLTATLRAIGDGGKVKKSDLMVFEVEPAVVAEPATELPQSEFEAMEERIQALFEDTAYNAQIAKTRAESAVDSASAANNDRLKAETAARQAAADAEAVARDKVIALHAQDEMKGAFERYPGNNLLNLDTVVYGKGIDKSGKIGVLDDSDYDISLTDYIPVSPGDVLSYQHTNPETGQREYGSLFSVCLFDAGKAVNLEANNYTAGEDGELREITIPDADVAYVRFTLYDLPKLLDPAIVRCHELVPYEPFTGVFRLKKDAYNVEQVQEQLQAVRYVAQTLTEEQQKQARQNIGALGDDFTVTVNDVVDVDSPNPINSRALQNLFELSIRPYLLPLAANEQSYYILRVKMGGGGYELVPIQRDAYIQQWILPYLLPQVSDTDNGKILQVVNGEWQLV